MNVISQSISTITWFFSFFFFKFRWNNVKCQVKRWRHGISILSCESEFWISHMLVGFVIHFCWNTCPNGYSNPNNSWHDTTRVTKPLWVSQLSVILDQTVLSVFTARNVGCLDVLWSWEVSLQIIKPLCQQTTHISENANLILAFVSKTP